MDGSFQKVQLRSDEPRARVAALTVPGRAFRHTDAWRIWFGAGCAHGCGGRRRSLQNPFCFFFFDPHTRSLLALLRGRTRRPSGAPPRHRHDVPGASPRKGYRFSEGRRTAAIEGGRDSWVITNSAATKNELRFFWQRVPRNEFPQLRVPSFARQILNDEFMMSVLPPIPTVLEVTNNNKNP